MLVITGERHLDIQRIQQFHRAPGIFGGDEA